MTQCLITFFFIFILKLSKEWFIEIFTKLFLIIFYTLYRDNGLPLFLYQQINFTYFLDTGNYRLKATISSKIDWDSEFPFMLKFNKKFIEFNEIWLTSLIINGKLRLSIGFTSFRGVSDSVYVFYVLSNPKGAQNVSWLRLRGMNNCIEKLCLIWARYCQFLVVSIYVINKKDEVRFC